MVDPRSAAPAPGDQPGAPMPPPSNPLGRVLRDVFLLSLGLLVGFLWSERTAAWELRQTHHIMIGLSIILGQMIRYVFLAQRQGTAGLDRASLQFFRELAVFLVGLVIGLVWFQFYTAFHAEEVHFIVVLLVLIFSIGRYLAILRQQADDGRNRN